MLPRANSKGSMPESLVVDASAMVDLLVGAETAAAIGERLRGNELSAPANFDAEVFSAIGRLHRARALTDHQARDRITDLSTAPITRHDLAPLLRGAWKLRLNLRLVDALYVALAAEIGAVIITTDNGLAAASRAAELISA